MKATRSIVFSISLLLASASPSLATGIVLGSLGGTIVWDGKGKVATSNELLEGTDTTLYSRLGLSDPSQLEVVLSLTGLDTIGVEGVGVLFSHLDGPCAGCATINEAQAALFPSVSFNFGFGDLDEPVIPFYTMLIGPSVARDGDSFLLSESDQALLRELLQTPGFGPDQLYLGLTVLTSNTPFDPGVPFEGPFRISFDVTAVPEPATVVLVGTGLVLARMKKRRRC